VGREDGAKAIQKRGGPFADGDDEDVFYVGERDWMGLDLQDAGVAGDMGGDGLRNGGVSEGVMEDFCGVMAGKLRHAGLRRKKWTQ